VAFIKPFLVFFVGPEPYATWKHLRLVSHAGALRGMVQSDEFFSGERPIRGARDRVAARQVMTYVHSDCSWPLLS